MTLQSSGLGRSFKEPRSRVPAAGGPGPSRPLFCPSPGRWFVSTGKDNLLNAWRTPYGASIFQVPTVPSWWPPLESCVLDISCCGAPTHTHFRFHSEHNVPGVHAAPVHGRVCVLEVSGPCMPSALRAFHPLQRQWVTPTTAHICFPLDDFIISLHAVKLEKGPHSPALVTRGWACVMLWMGPGLHGCWVSTTPQSAPGLDSSFY